MDENDTKTTTQISLHIFSCSSCHTIGKKMHFVLWQKSV